MPNARILIAGLGVASAIGVGRAAFSRALRDGASGIGPVTLFDVGGYRTDIAAEVRDFDPARALGKVRVGSRSDALAIVAASDAITDARLPAERARSLGLVVGTTTAGMLENERHLVELLGDPDATEPLVSLFSHPISAPADHIAEALGIAGAPRRAICSACSSSAHALAVAADLLRRRVCDVVLAGGTDALCRLTYSGFNALAALDPQPCRPFDATRRGLNLGEGAGFLVLAREDALWPGAEVLAELAGVGSVSEAHHITHPRPDAGGAIRALRLALADAGLDPSSVDYVSAHGTATPLNDPMEAKAIREVLGPQADVAWVSSTKSQIGHTLGAAGAIECVATVLAIQGGFAPPTLRLVSPDPACAVRLVGPEAERTPIDVALSNSFGFGGSDVSLCITRPGRAPSREARTRPGVVVTGLGALVGDQAGLGVVDAILDGSATVPPADVRSISAAAAPSGLETARARRLDRFARYATEVARQAFAQSTALPTPLPTAADADRESAHRRTRIGAVVGTMWGSLDASAAFMRRVLGDGAHRAAPADFPNLVISSGAGHVSIYHQLMGPSWTVSADAASGLVAVISGAEEIDAGRADQVAAIGVEVESELVLRLHRLFHGTSAARGEGAGALLLESEPVCHARGETPLARVAAAEQLTFVPGDDADAASRLRAMLDRLVGDAQEALLVVAKRSEALEAALEGRPGVRVVEVQPVSGAHEGIGAICAACAVRAVARGETALALTVEASIGAVFGVAFSPA